MIGHGGPDHNVDGQPSSAYKIKKNKQWNLQNNVTDVIKWLVTNSYDHI